MTATSESRDAGVQTIPVGLSSVGTIPHENTCVAKPVVESGDRATTGNSKLLKHKGGRRIMTSTGSIERISTPGGPGLGQLCLENAGSKPRPGAFMAGMLVGTALSMLCAGAIVYGFRPHLTLSLAVAILCLLGTLRILRHNRVLRSAAGISGVVLGGFLLSIGTRLAAADLHVTVISIGVVAFLSGISMLLYDRGPKPEVRAGIVRRLTEDEIPEALREETEALMSASDVAALARGIGTKERFSPPGGRRRESPTTGYSCFGSLVAAEGSSSTNKL